MSLLELEQVTRTCKVGARTHTVLDDVTLSVEAGELVAIWGTRDSGRGTLLRVAAGIEPPDSGCVRFAGRELSCGQALGAGIGYCSRQLRSGEGRRVLEEITGALLARGMRKKPASERARAALERCGAMRCAASMLGELDGAEAVRTSLARVIATSPQLIVIDEPTTGVDLLERDSVLGLLRSLADDGVAVLMSASEGPSLAGADRVLSLSDGRLRGSLTPQLAPVLPLRRRVSA